MDIPPIKPKVTEYQKIRVTCQCGKVHTGQFPETIKAYVQIGSVLKSMLVYFNVQHVIPYQRLTQIMNDLFGVKICKRTIENTLIEGGNKASPVCDQIMSLILSAPWVGSDETGCRVRKKRWWQWVWQTPFASYYAVDKSRGYAVVKEHFGENYDGVLIHDCWSAHNNTVAKAGHQQCIAHIQRDLQFLIEAYRSKWAYDFSEFLKSAQKARDHIYSDDFDSTLKTTVIEAYRNKLNQFLVKTGHNNDILRLQKRIIKHQDAILLFMNYPDLPAHNNGSERAIRMAKVKQKISGCFRSPHGASRYVNILSVIETAKKHNLHILTAIQHLFSGSLVFSACPR